MRGGKMFKMHSLRKLFDELLSYSSFFHFYHKDFVVIFVGKTLTFIGLFQEYINISLRDKVCNTSKDTLLKVLFKMLFY